METGNESVLAYIRRDSTRAMLIVANLGATQVSGPALRDEYRLRNRAGLPMLAARRAYIFELEQRRPTSP